MGQPLSYDPQQRSNPSKMASLPRFRDRERNSDYHVTGRREGGRAMATKRRAVHKAAKKTTKATKPKLQHTAWASVELENLNPLLQRRFVVGGKVMLARILLKTGCVVP